MKWLTMVSMQSKGIKSLTQKIIELQKTSQDIYFSSKVVQTYHTEGKYQIISWKNLSTIRCCKLHNLSLCRHFVRSATNDLRSSKLWLVNKGHSTRKKSAQTTFLVMLRAFYSWSYKSESFKMLMSGSWIMIHDVGESPMVII